MTTVYWLGDSFLTAQPSGIGVAAVASTYLGWTATIDGWGGRGYLNPGVAGASQGTFAQRLPTLIAANPDIAIIEGGGNDIGATTGEFADAVASTFATLRASLPNVPLYVTAGHRQTQALFDATVAATGLTKGTFIDWGDVVEYPRSGGVRWLTGTGNTGSVIGDGNRDVYLYTDAIHLNVAGGAYIGTRMAQAIRPPATGLDY